MYFLPTGFQNLEAIALVALLFLSFLSGNLIFIIASLALIAIFHPHRSENKSEGFSV